MGQLDNLCSAPSKGMSANFMGTADAAKRGNMSVGTYCSSESALVFVYDALGKQGPSWFQRRPGSRHAGYFGLTSR